MKESAPTPYQLNRADRLDHAIRAKSSVTKALQGQEEIIVETIPLDRDPGENPDDYTVTVNPEFANGMSKVIDSLIHDLVETGEKGQEMVNGVVYQIQTEQMFKNKKKES